MENNIKRLLNDLKTGLQELYGSRLKSVYLYGSYARGTNDEDSDVDVLIVIDEFTGTYGAEVDRTGALIAGLSLQHNVSISRVFVTERDWRDRHSFFLANVREEAVAA